MCICALLPLVGRLMALMVVSLIVQREEEVQKCVAEANVFALAAHLYWGVFAILQARWTPVEFDYLGYTQWRLSEYHRRKSQFLSEAAEWNY